MVLAGDASIAEQALQELVKMRGTGRGKQPAPKQSQYRNIYWKRGHGRWEALVRVRGKTLVLATGTVEEQVRERAQARLRDLGLAGLLRNVLVPKKQK